MWEDWLLDSLCSWLRAREADYAVPLDQVDGTVASAISNGVACANGGMLRKSVPDFMRKGSQQAPACNETVQPTCSSAAARKSSRVVILPPPPGKPNGGDSVGEPRVSVADYLENRTT